MKRKYLVRERSGPCGGARLVAASRHGPANPVYLHFLLQVCQVSEIRSCRSCYPELSRNLRKFHSVQRRPLPSTWGNLLLLRRFVKPRSLKLPLVWVMIFVADRHFMPTSTYHVETTIEHSVFIVKALEDTFTKEKALLLGAFSGHCETSQRSKVQLCFVPAESW